MCDGHHGASVGVPQVSPQLRDLGCGWLHRNPVARELAESPEQWRWSSFRSYLYGEPEPVRINDTEILVMQIRSVRSSRIG